MESPSFFSARISSSNARFCPGPGRKTDFARPATSLCFQRNVTHLGQAAANLNAKFPARYFFAIAPAATRMAVSRAKSARRRDNRADRIFVRRCNRMAWTENVFNGAVILRTLVGISINKPMLVPVVTPSKTPESF